MEKRKLDMSLGDPLYPFRSAARYAFREAAKDLNRYRFMNRGNSDPEIQPIYRAISDFFTARGIQPPNWSGLSYGHFTMTGGGTTEGYNLIIQLLIQDVQKENKRLNRDIKPAILMPVPTYGFFMHQPEQWGIEVIPIERDLKGNPQITAPQLLRAIKAAHKDGFRIISYFDSNPNNPLGTIRNEADTRALTDVFLAVREHYKREDQAALKAWQQTQPDIEIKMLDEPMRIKPGRIWEGPANRIRIIDDMVYDSLEYGSRKAFAFAQVDELFKDTFTLFGPSKAGLANIRGGIVIAEDKDIYNLERLRINNNYFPSRATLSAMQAFYSPKEPFAAAREKHMTKLNRDHRFHGLFMKALVNGIHTLIEATDDDKKKIIATYARLENCSKSLAEMELKRGIRNVKIITTPEAGFFHLLDFSALRGGTYQSPRNHWQHDKPFEDDYSLIDILENELNISSCNSSWMGMPMNSLLSRATFAIPLEDILEYTKRVRRAAVMLSPQRPILETTSCCTASTPPRPFKKNPQSARLIPFKQIRVLPCRTHSLLFYMPMKNNAWKRCCMICRGMPPAASVCMPAPVTSLNGSAPPSAKPVSWNPSCVNMALIPKKAWL